MTRPLHIGPAALPGPLRTVAELVDVPTALAIAKAFGGRRIHAPAEVRRHHQLARVVGLRIARLIAASPRMTEHIDETNRIHWPSARRVIEQAEAQRLRTAGKSIREIAKRLRLTPRTVERHVAGLPKGLPCPDEMHDGDAACPVCGHRRRRGTAAVDDRQLPLIPLRPSAER